MRVSAYVNSLIVRVKAKMIARAAAPVDHRRFLDVLGDRLEEPHVQRLEHPVHRAVERAEQPFPADRSQ
jgi:hypothetical protein